MRIGIIFAVLALGWQGPAFAVDVVVNAARAETAAGRSLMRGLFGMRVRAWPDGAPVHVFVLDDGAALHVEFCRKVLQTYPYPLRESWDRLLYSGTGQGPVVLAAHSGNYVLSVGLPDKSLDGAPA